MEHSSLKIGVFAYNFEHKKTQEGLVHLFLNRYQVSCILAADPVELKFYQSKIRVTPKGLRFMHPKDIAERLNMPYYVVGHNSAECETLIKRYKLDVGIILGARILSDRIIDSFKIGVLNMHPGLLPQNRGLDNLKWAILNGLKQGVSCHFIDKKIDRGRLIIQKEIPVYKDDTLLDINLRLQNMEQISMIESLRMIESGKNNFPEVEEGNYFGAVPEDLESVLLEKFVEYKNNLALS